MQVAVAFAVTAIGADWSMDDVLGCDVAGTGWALAALAAGLLAAASVALGV